MATTHIQFNDQSQEGRIVRRFLNAVDDVLNLGDQINRFMPTMIDGDGSDISMFTLAVSLVGFTDTTNAKAFWDEFQSCYSKVSGDGSVSSVNTALKQIAAKCR